MEFQEIVSAIKSLDDMQIKEIKEACCFLLRKKKPVHGHPGRPRVYQTAEEAKKHQLEQMRAWRKRQVEMKNCIISEK